MKVWCRGGAGPVRAALADADLTSVGLGPPCADAAAATPADPHGNHRFNDVEVTVTSPRSISGEAFTGAGGSALSCP